MRVVSGFLNGATAACIVVLLFSACARPQAPAERGRYLLELQQSLSSASFEDAVAAAHGGLSQEPHSDDEERTEEYLRLGGAAALSALGQEAEALQLLRPLYDVPQQDKPETNAAALGGMATLEAETLAVLIELELRAAELTPALCALEVLHVQRGLEHETLRTAAILYRALDLNDAATSAETAAAELAHAYGIVHTARGDASATTATNEAATTATTATVQQLDCSVYGGVAAHSGVTAYREYLEYRGRAGGLSGRELDHYAELEPVLFRFPGYYMGLVNALKELLPNYSLSSVRPLLERVILLSPHGPHAQSARQELGDLLGIGNAHGERLLLGMEIEDIASRLFVSGVPETVAPIVDLLSTPENPYRSAGRLLLMQAMELPGMRDYLKARHETASGELREALELILASS